MTLPWTMLKTAVQIPMKMMSWVVPKATVIRNAIALVTNCPMYGMNPPKNDSTATGSANGIPSSVMITKPVIGIERAEDAGRDHVAAEHDDRLVARPPGPRARASRRSCPVIHAQALLPSRRKK